MTAGDLHDALAPLGAKLMVRAIDSLEHDNKPPGRQGEAGITYAAKMRKLKRG